MLGSYQPFKHLSQRSNSQHPTRLPFSEATSPPGASRKALQLYELSAQLKRDIAFKQQQRHSQLQLKQREDQEVLRQANEALRLQASEQVQRRKALQDLARFNLSEARLRREQSAVERHQFETDVQSLRQQYEQEQLHNERSYNDKYSRIQKQQEARQHQFQQLFLQPTAQRWQRIDEKIANDCKAADQTPASIWYQRQAPASLEFSAHKFFGVDVTDNRRLAKTALKTETHDPITGVQHQYSSGVAALLPLGTQRPRDFPGKILDSPVKDVQYAPPSHTKKTPRYTAYNPLTHEAVTFKHWSARPSLAKGPAGAIHFPPATHSFANLSRGQRPNF